MSHETRWGATILTCLLVLLGSFSTVSATAGVKGKKHLGAVVAPLRLVSTSGDPVSVEGLHRYFGTIELRSASDGLVIVNGLPLERYLLGLDEVPSQWPTEALRAQAVAARTYALWTLGQPRGGAAATYGFDICASTDCQVFSGAEVVAGLLGERWQRAVEDTASRTVLYAGKPILARYHSVSGGHTFANEEIFTDEGSYPYLKGVPSRAEEGSPLARWSTSFPVARAQAILEEAGLWDGGRLRRASVRGSGRASTGPRLVFIGTEGRAVVNTQDFRDAARDIAPARWPDAYPAAAPTGTGRLPETMPSNRVAVRMQGKLIVFDGRGWGHGVGMSQWGAEGLARRGASHDEILRHYYSGVSVGDYRGPDRVSVGVDWGRSDVTVSGAFRIVDGRGRTVVPEALGTWGFHDAGAGSVSIDPPAGHGLPLRVGLVEAPKEVEVGDVFMIRAALSRPARVALSIEGERGEPLIKERGVVSLSIRAPEEPGEYSIAIDARSGKSRSDDRAPLSVRASEESVGPIGPAEPGSTSPPWLIVGAGLLVLSAIIYGITVTIRR